MKENIAPGVTVRCCEAYEEVRLGDTGRVIKVGMNSSIPRPAIAQRKSQMTSSKAHRQILLQPSIVLMFFSLPPQVDNDGLHDLNVQANWQQKGGSYWVRFANCELLATETAGMTTFKQGDRVRVKRSVSTPK